MEPEFNELNLRKSLLDMPKWQKIVFALSICERMYPNFVAFSIETGHKGKSFLKKCLDLTWKSIEINDFETDFSEQAQMCEDIAPSTEEYQYLLTSSALDAAASIAYLMNYFKDNNNDHIIEIASLSRDSVDMHVQNIEKIDLYDPNMEKKIIDHPLMQTELVKQKKAIEFIKTLKGNSACNFKVVKEKWKSTKVGSLNLKISGN